MGKTIVVGAGFAGLSAAYQLKKAGIDFTVYEASGRVGGRVVDVFREDGIHYPASALMTEPQWSTTFEYIKEFGLEKDIYTSPKMVAGFARDGKIYYLTVTTGKNSVNIGEVLRFRGMPLKTIPQGLKFLKAIGEYRDKLNADHLDFSCLSEISDTSVAEYGKANGGPELVNYVLDPLIGGLTLGPSEGISAHHPVALMNLMEGQCTLKRGLSEISDALYGAVADRVLLNTPVEEIVIDDGEVKGVRTAHSFVEADSVVCALDAVLARRLMPNLPQTIDDALATCVYSGSFSYTFGVPKQLLPDYFMSLMIPASDNSLITTIGDLNAGMFGELAPKGYGIISTFTKSACFKQLDDMPQEIRTRIVIEEIQKYAPDFPDEPDWVDEKRFERAINLEAPGQFRAIEDLKKNHADDVTGLYLAGEYMFGLPSTEAALSTGRDAALRLISKNK